MRSVRIAWERFGLAQNTAGYRWRDGAPDHFSLYGEDLPLRMEQDRAVRGIIEGQNPGELWVDIGRRRGSLPVLQRGMVQGRLSGVARAASRSPLSQGCGRQSVAGHRHPRVASTQISPPRGLWQRATAAQRLHLVCDGQQSWRRLGGWRRKDSAGFVSMATSSRAGRGTVSATRPFDSVYENKSGDLLVGDQ